MNPLISSSAEIYINSVLPHLLSDDSSEISLFSVGIDDRIAFFKNISERTQINNANVFEYVGKYDRTFDIGFFSVISLSDFCFYERLLKPNSIVVLLGSDHIQSSGKIIELASIYGGDISHFILSDLDNLSISLWSRSSSLKLRSYSVGLRALDPLSLLDFPVRTAEIDASKLRFLEHVISNGFNQVVCRYFHDIYVSDDGCKTWRFFFGCKSHSIDHYVKSCKTLKNGNKIFKIEGSELILLVDSLGALIKVNHVGIHSWHGSWGIDESTDGVVMYGEYAVDSPQIRVWKSVDGGYNWDSVYDFSASEIPSDDGALIRHIHVCSWSVELNKWIISTGDKSTQCQLWSLEQYGDNMTQHFVRNVAGINPYGYNSTDRRALPIDYWPRLFRHTACVFLDGYLYYATDDLLGIGYSLFVRYSFLTSTVDILSVIANSPARSLTYDPGRGLFVITTEMMSNFYSNSNYGVVSILNKFGDLILSRYITNVKSQRSSLTNSVSSKFVVNDVFFAFDDSAHFLRNCLLFRLNFDKF